MTITLAIPRLVYQQWGTPLRAEVALKAQGLWPAQIEGVRWYIDPVGLLCVAELTVRLRIEEGT